MAGTEVPPSWEWKQEYVAEPASVADVRRALTAFARAHGAEEPLLGDLALAVSEAATNAVVHAFADTAPGRLWVSAAPGDASIHVLVGDDGHGMRPRGDSPGLGLGLPTIAQLTRSFDIRDGPGGRGTEVHMVFDAPGVQAPAPAPDRDAWRYELLAEVARLAGGAGWPGEGVERLVDLLVPAVADACAVDLVEPDGPRRVAARVAGDGDGALTSWLATRRPPAEAFSAAIPAMQAGDVHITVLTDEANRALAVGDEDLDRMAGLGLRWWVNVALSEAGAMLGSLGLGLAAERPAPDAEVAFYGALGERAARGLASTQLVEELRRTRRRLERILSALSEAVTVQDGTGAIVYANDAAARLLGAASVDEILAAEPGDLAGRFLITREDGTPVTLTELPGYAVLGGRGEAALLTRSVVRSTGDERWLLTKATLLEDGEPFAVNIIEDITETRSAELRRRLLAEAGELLASGAGPERVAALCVPALADWCAIEAGGGELAAAGHAPRRRSEIEAPIGDRGTLRLATVEGGRALGAEHEAFAAELAARLAPALGR